MSKAKTPKIDQIEPKIEQVDFKIEKFDKIEKPKPTPKATPRVSTTVSQIGNPKKSYYKPRNKKTRNPK